MLRKIAILLGAGLAFGAPMLVGTQAARAADVVFDEGSLPAPESDTAPVYLWSGPYAGAFVGYNFANVDQDGGASVDMDGFVGGVYSGYNFESAPVVYGIEADIGGSGVDGSGFNTGLAGRIDGDQNIFGSLRGRVGVAADPFLAFATGGIAASQNTLSLGGASDTKTSVGYTVGAGVEANFSENVSGRLEYRYSNFGDKTYDLGTTSVSSGFDEHSIRAGVAVKF